MPALALGRQGYHGAIIVMLEPTARVHRIFAVNRLSHPVCLAFASLLSFPLAAATSSAAQCPEWESFSSAGLQGSGSALAVFDDGTGPMLYCAGSFTYAGSVPAVEIVRFDGATWSALGSGLTQGAVSTHANALAVFDDGS